MLVVIGNGWVSRLSTVSSVKMCDLNTAYIKISYIYIHMYIYIYIYVCVFTVSKQR